MKLASVTPSHISTITALTKHLANSTRQKSIAILVPMFKLAIDEELIQFSPIKHIHKIKRKQLEEKRIYAELFTQPISLSQSIANLERLQKLKALFQTMTAYSSCFIWVFKMLKKSGLCQLETGA